MLTARAHSPYRLSPRRRSRSPECWTACDAGASAGRPAWATAWTPIPPGRQLHLPGVVRNDEGLRRWLEEEGDRHYAEQLSGSAALDCVDLSHNGLSDCACSPLVDFLLQKGLPTKRLKLFNNNLRSPKALCRLIEHDSFGVASRDGLMEIHLSHNGLTATFLGELLESVARCGVRGGQPLWLRAEKNGLNESDVDRVLPQRGLKVCYAGGQRRAGGHCTLHRCHQGADVHVVLAPGKPRPPK